MASNRYLNKSELELFNKMNPIFDYDQMEIINQKTPKSEIETKINNGEKYDFVKSSYLKKIVTLVTGGQYNFEIKNQTVINGANGKEIKTEARLTIYSKGKVFYRDQCGGYSGGVSTYGFKASASDAFRKCAFEFGFCWDITNQEPEKVNKEPQLTYPEHSVYQKMKDEFKECEDLNTLDEKWKEFENNNKVLKIHKDIYKEHYNRIIGT